MTAPDTPSPDPSQPDRLPDQSPDQSPAPSAPGDPQIDLSALRVLFAGTPDFSVPALKALVTAGAHVGGVLTQPDRPAGRGKKITQSAVKECALSLSLNVLQPPTLKEGATVEMLRELRPDVMIVVAYGLLLPQRVLDIPTHGCLNIHGSLLPRWRGAAPIHRAVLAGDSQTGVTIMQMEAGLDTGPMIAKKVIPITPTSTTASLHDALARLGATTLVSVLADWCAGRLTATVQDESLVTYAEKLHKREAIIDWGQSAVQIDRQVRGLNPWPVAESFCGKDRVRFYAGDVQSAPSVGDPGEVLECSKAGIAVNTGEGVYRITTLQWPGKRAMAAADFVNSRDITGQRFHSEPCGEEQNDAQLKTAGNRPPHKASGV